MLKWLLILLAVVFVCILVGSFSKIFRLKRNIIESNLSLSVYCKRKETLMDKITEYLKQRKIAQETGIYEILEEFRNTKNMSEKVGIGDTFSQKLNELIQKEYQLRFDAEIMEQITVLKEVDEKIRQSKDKYEISIVSYDVARKHNILFFSNISLLRTGKCGVRY